MMKCKDCKHYNGATMPGAGLCNATQARTFATTVCFNGLFSPEIQPASRRLAGFARNRRFSFCMEIPSPTALPVGTCFFRCKGIALEEHSSTATLFEHNFSAAFPIFNRPYFADAQYRNYKILPKFLACFSLKGNL